MQKITFLLFNVENKKNSKIYLPINAIFCMQLIRTKSRNTPKAKNKKCTQTMYPRYSELNDTIRA